MVAVARFAPSSIEARKAVSLVSGVVVGRSSSLISRWVLGKLKVSEGVGFAFLVIA